MIIRSVFSICHRFTVMRVRHISEVYNASHDEVVTVGEMFTVKLYISKWLITTLKMPRYVSYIQKMSKTPNNFQHT